MLDSIKEALLNRFHFGEKSDCIKVDAPIGFAGEMKIWPGATIPNGFLSCNGASLLRSDYPDLFLAIGTAHGAADATHFNLPDTRGMFLRGVDGGAANDPDRAARTAAKTGGNTGDTVGSAQGENIKAHAHNRNYWKGNSFSTGDWVSGGYESPAYLKANGWTAKDFGSDNFGGNETRPKNINVNFIIKY